MSARTTSVLIPTYRRPGHLTRCLLSLARQQAPPSEVIVVWQGDDRESAEASGRLKLPYSLRLFHNPEVGIVPAENMALEAAAGEIIMLIDDDAAAPPDWIARHQRHYDDPQVGAVGGPADNFFPDGTPYPKRDVEPVGKLAKSGRVFGNMYDHVREWRSRPPAAVDHLVGYNMSLRRRAFGRFESSLKPYWQMFEMEACLQVRARGYKIVFDFANVVEHFPTNPAYAGGRDGDLGMKIYNAAYNHAFLLSKHSPPELRLRRLLYLFLVGSSGVPGLAAGLRAMWRYRKPMRELAVVYRTWSFLMAGWGQAAPLRSRRRRMEAGCV